MTLIMEASRTYKNKFNPFYACAEEEHLLSRRTLRKIEIAALFADGSRLGTHTDELGEGIGFVPQHAHHQKQNQHMRSFAAVGDSAVFLRTSSTYRYLHESES